MVAITDPGKRSASIPHHDDIPRGLPQSRVGRRPLLRPQLRRPGARRRSSGIDLDPLLASAAAMLAACRRADPPPTRASPSALALGAAGHGRPRQADLRRRPRASRSLGAWLEQLIAESTGKPGSGSCRSTSSRSAPPARTARTASSSGSRSTARPAAVAPDGTRPTTLLDALAAAGHPVLRIVLADPIDLGGRVRPLGGRDGDRRDRPRRRPVRPAERRRSRRRTRRASSRSSTHNGRFPAEVPLATGNGIALYGDTALRLTAGDGGARRRAAPPPRPGARPAATSPSARSSPRRPPGPRRSTGSGRRLRDATGLRDDRRLRAALPPLHRPAPQGRRRRSAGSSS